MARPTCLPVSDHHQVLDELRLRRLRQHAVAVPGGHAVFDATGGGALDCLQGLLTNDLVRPGPGTMVHGALLTPKGMIVVDGWALRLADRIVLVMPLHGREAALDIFQKSLPPRLARVTDRSDAWTAIHLYGDETWLVLERAGLPIPSSAGHLLEASGEDGEAIYVTACPPPQAPFRALLLCPTVGQEDLMASLREAGAEPGTAADAEAARILAGWPALGAEIGEKTLPQEVRYDEIGSVSYTKGCYTGQETVARVHFRGHPNRELRGLVWDDTDPLEGETVEAGDRIVGTIGSSLALPRRRLGLSSIRREVETGQTVTAGGRSALVVPLPFPEPLIDD